MDPETLNTSVLVYVARSGSYTPNNWEIAHFDIQKRIRFE